MAPIAVSPERDSTPSNLDLTTTYTDTIRFYLNGTRVVLDEIDPEVTLLEYLRGIGLTGTKLGCAEGGCGACTVVISQYNPTTKQIYHASVNACLAPLASVDGKHVITIEGIGSVKKPHPAQERIAKSNGSQCGFCTPGIVMSLYALLRNNEDPSNHDIEEAFDGNLCRCTGYRPILDAAQTFSSVKSTCGKSSANGGSGCCMENGNGSGPDGGCCKNKSLDDGQPIKKFVRPDFIEYNPNTELIFPPALRKHEFKPLSFGNKRKRWYRPVTLDQLLEIKSVYPNAKIIGGSTETQIEIKFKALEYPVSVFVGDIPELRHYAFKNDYLEIGGNVILTDLENICQEAIKHYGDAKGQVFEAIYKQLKYFAGRQIRNVGTPAGNLATASPISDLNPVFMAADCVLIAKSKSKETELPMATFFKGYRRTALEPDAIIASIRIPITREKGDYFRAYKQAKRKDDDIAIVTSALHVRVNEKGTVEHANLVYGGMAPFTVAAKKTNEYLKGKMLAHPDTIEGAMNALGTDFDLVFSVPGGMASYRKALALSFFYRFYHDVLAGISAESEHGDSQAVEELDRALSSGRHDEEATDEYAKETLGKPANHVAALKQTTGEAQYTDDIPPFKNELHAALVLSTRAHAKIKSIDYSAALDIPGVVEVVDKNDIKPEQNKWGAPQFDDLFFAEDEVFTAGQPIAIVLATTQAKAVQGVRAVRVEYEDLPAVFTMEEAIEKESYHNFYRYIKKGDPEEAFKDCDYTFSGVSRMGGQEHFYLETNACLAIPKEDGEMEIWSSSQNPTECQAYASKVLGVDANKVVCRVKRLGGGFGGKETRCVHLSTIMAIAANKAKQPVRCMLNRDEDMVMSGQRHPFLAKWKVGVNKDGKLQALDMDLFANAGWSLDLSAGVCERAMTHADNCYKIPNVHIRGRLCKTNTMSNTAFRGFGGPQGLFFAETYMSEVADRLGMPVEELRQINFYEPDELTHYNTPLEDWHVPLMYKQVLEEADYANRRKAVEAFNKSHKWRKRGLAIIPTKFGISFTALFLNQAGALVHVYHDGSVLVAHGGTEMGQGLNTKMITLAAQALRVPLESVHITDTSTNTVANTSPTAASASSDLNGYAVWNACEQINARLAPYREKLGAGATMKELAHAAYFDRVNLSANGFYKTPDIGYTWGENTGRMFFYFTQGVAAAEVELDCLTGTWTCLRADVKMDVGRSINPSIDYGQIEGAFVQGLGLYTMEESLWLRNGAAAGNLATKGPGAYKIPGFRDIPQVFNVGLLKGVEWKNLRTIQRSRGVGEPPLFMGSSVFFAIRDALKAARADYGVVASRRPAGSDEEEEGSDGLLRLESPATPERIRLSCVDPIMERARVVPKDGEKSFFIAI
ncbi:xanthine dehydrogenase [Xylariomycetidae sp. FL2044]|nr:xanthine dehydrogenase [Xylariomycetidae sp. FL2044]